MVEVLMPSSIVNRSLQLPDYSTTAAILDLGYSRGVGSYEVVNTEVDNGALREKVLRQVEWYFSDENLLKDAFLMKHITRNKHGHVSLKLVASLRKIKGITKDCEVVADAIRQSKELELNDDATKVRRINPVPDVDYSGIPKSIIVTNYPINNPDVSQIEQEYSRYGEISQVLVIAPGKAIPLSIKSCKSRFPCIGKELCIFVEFSTQEMAVRACKESQRNWRQTATVQLLSDKQQDDQIEASRSSSPVGEKKLRKKASPEQSSTKPVTRTRQLKTSSKSGYISDSGYSGASRSPSSSPKSSPAPMRRAGFVTPKLSLKPIAPLVTVIRNPLGPDGTKGFSGRR